MNRLSFLSNDIQFKVTKRRIVISDVYYSINILVLKFALSVDISQADTADKRSALPQLNQICMININLLSVMQQCLTEGCISSAYF